MLNCETLNTRVLLGFKMQDIVDLHHPIKFDSKCYFENHKNDHKNDHKRRTSKYRIGRSANAIRFRQRATTNGDLQQKHGTLTRGSAKALLYSNGQKTILGSNCNDSTKSTLKPEALVNSEPIAVDSDSDNEVNVQNASLNAQSLSSEEPETNDKVEGSDSDIREDTHSENGYGEKDLLNETRQRKGECQSGITNKLEQSETQLTKQQV